MKTLITMTLITILSLVFIITISFVLGQDTKNTEMTKADNNKLVKNLTINNNLEKYGIEIVPCSDKNFADLLTQYIGKNEELTSLVELTIPFSFFIKNNSSKEVVGVSLQWKFVRSSGKIEKIPQIEANPGVLMGMKPIDPKMVGKTSMINSKTTKFFTYFNDIVGHKIAFANMRFKNPSINYKFHFDSENSQRDISFLNSQKERVLNDITDISVSIDGIFFNDGTFIGEDQNFFFDSLRGEIQARKDFLTALIEVKSSGKNNSDIVDDILSKTSNISVSYEQLRSSNANSEQAFIIGYKSYLKSLRGELIMQRSKMSDDYIVSQIQPVRVSDFKTLRKIDD